jgi:SPP1 family predicted phage head-tail adaptor
MRQVPAGKRREQVAVYRDTGTARDAHGQHAEDWEFLVTLWGEYAALSGRELALARQRVATTDAVVRVPYYPGLTAADRVEVNGVLHAVEAVFDEGEMTKELALYLREMPDRSGGLLLLEGGPPAGFLALEQGGRLRLEA